MGSFYSIFKIHDTIFIFDINDTKYRKVSVVLSFLMKFMRRTPGDL